jgi:hypothetical protein
MFLSSPLVCLTVVYHAAQQTTFFTKQTTKLTFNQTLAQVRVVLMRAIII